MDYEFEPACRRMEWLDPFYKSVWEKAFADAIPISGTFELTPRCNFDCRMCYVHLKEQDITKYGQELSAKDWLRVAKEAKEAGTTWLCITGGEPLLHPEFDTIWKELSQMGFFITLQTNASLIQGKKLDLLEKYPPRFVKTTIYGAGNETYEKVCGVKNGFENVDKGIQNLKKLNIPVETVSTIIKENEADIPRIAFYAYKNRLSWTPAAGVKSSVRNEKGSLEEIKIQIADEDQFQRHMVERLEKNPIDVERKPCTYCKDYRLGYWITWDGKMRFCSFMNRPDIPVLKLGLKTSWEELVKYEEALRWPQQCYSCEASKICFKCAGTLNAECGGPQQVTEEFCEKYKKVIKEYRRLKTK